MDEQVGPNLPEYRGISVTDPAGEVRLDFETADSVRHKARLAGMNPNYWYPAEWSKNVECGKHSETAFWSESIVLFRTSAGEVAALENRCAHRHLPLTMGKVKGCHLVCAYHGWAYDKDGVLQSVQHDLFGRTLPGIQIRTYPVQERYGLIWIFPGDPKLADKVPLPVLPNAEGPESWPHMSFDFCWKAHFSMVIDNLANLTHLYVHGNMAPFDRTCLVHSDLEGDRLQLVWSHTLRPSLMRPINRVFLLATPESEITDTQSVYDYPYHAAMSNSRGRSVNLMLPKSPTETRVFTMQYWKPFDIPMMSRSLSRRLMEKVIVPLMRPGVVEIYRQDGDTVEAEMKRLEGNFFKPIPEINHSVKLFDRLNSERWQAWLDYRSGRRRDARVQEKVMVERPILEVDECYARTHSSTS